MKIIKPCYYDDFKCAASSCNNPCCKAGWQIIIDEQTLSFYNSCGGEIGGKLKENIDNKSDEPMFKYKGSSCAFFDKDGLCEIQRNFGHDRLCRTCRMYPRYEYTFGGTKEIGLELSCPTVAHILNKKTEPVKFIETVTDELPEPNEINPELYFYVKKCRTLSLDIIQNRSENLALRIQKLLCFNEKVSAEIKNKTYSLPEIPKMNDGKISLNTYSEYFNRLEVLSEKWASVLEVNLPQKIELRFCDNDFFFENLLVYFIFRYYLLSVYDRKILGRVRFTILSTALIKYLSLNDNCEEVAVMYSREIEHSEENVAKLIRYLDKQRI